MDLADEEAEVEGLEDEEVEGDEAEGRADGQGAAPSKQEDGDG
jgi:hypothetical protein